MAANNFVANTTIRKQLYLETAWKEHLPNSFFSKFWRFPEVGMSEHIQQDQSEAVMDSDQNMPIIIKRDLTKQQGDKITFSLVMALQGDGITGSSGKTLEGNEEPMNAYAFSIELEEYAHAVTDKNPLGRKRVMFAITEAMKDQLTGWGIEKMDKLIFSALEASPTSILYAGSATSTLTLTASDKATVALLRKAKVIAQTRNSGARFMIKPIRIGGKDWFVAVAPNDVLYDLKDDSEYKQAQQFALARSSDHPIFAGADAVFHDGIIVYGHERASIFTNWGAGADVAGGYISFFGQKAICLAMGTTPQVETEYKDYKRQIGYGYGMIIKASKPQFNSMDYGSLQIRVARTQIQDA